MNTNLINREKEAILQVYKRLKIVVERAEGCRIFDNDGNVYLDFLGGIAVNALGHSHPRIIQAAKEQIDKYMHISNYFYQEPQIKLAEKLKEISGFDKVYFSNSGAESIEGALKISRRWGNLNDRPEIISFSGGFHGRTYGALSLMDKPHYKDNMGPFLGGIKLLPYNDVEKLIEGISGKTAAVFLEFIQGEGGVSSVNREFTNKLAELRNIYGFLIIADEIQSGTGRTGSYFAYEQFGIKPDVVVMAKGVGGGLPLGAILVNKKLAGIFEKGMHGTTYGGNAVACATGFVVLDELESGLLAEVKKTSDYFHSELVKVAGDFPEMTEEVRGLGFLKGLKLKFEAGILVEELINLKVITNEVSGNVLRMVPPLIVKNSDINEFISKLRQALNNLIH